MRSAIGIVAWLASGLAAERLARRRVRVRAQVSLRSQHDCRNDRVAQRERVNFVTWADRSAPT